MTSWKRHKKSQREDAIELMQQIVETPCDATEERIYETCPYIIEQVRSGFSFHRTYDCLDACASSNFQIYLASTQIEQYLELPGVSKANFCAIALRDINRKALDKLLSTYSSTNVNHWQSHFAYRRAWVFFEQKRLFEGQAKSRERMHIESHYPDGLVYEPITGEFCSEPIAKRRGRPKKDTA